MRSRSHAVSNSTGGVSSFLVSIQYVWISSTSGQDWCQSAELIVWGKLSILAAAAEMIRESNLNICSQWGQTSSDLKWIYHLSKWVLWNIHAQRRVIVCALLGGVVLYLCVVRYHMTDFLPSCHPWELTWLENFKPSAIFPMWQLAPLVLPILYRGKLRCCLTFRGNSDA